jgi:hypothetical protein
MGYLVGATIFGGSDKDILGCVPDSEEAKIVRDIMKDIGFLKLEHDLYALKKCKMAECLAYSRSSLGPSYCILFFVPFDEDELYSQLFLAWCRVFLLSKPLMA